MLRQVSRRQNELSRFGRTPNRAERARQINWGFFLLFLISFFKELPIFVFVKNLQFKKQIHLLFLPLKSNLSHQPQLLEDVKEKELVLPNYKLIILPYFLSLSWIFFLFFFYCYLFFSLSFFYYCLKFI